MMVFFPVMDLNGKLVSILVFMCQVLVVMNQEAETCGSIAYIAITFLPISSASF